VRLFVALELPDALRRAAGERVAAEHPRLPAARWTHPDNLHLTLVFLGEVEEAAVDWPPRWRTRSRRTRR